MENNICIESISNGLKTNIDFNNREELLMAKKLYTLEISKIENVLSLNDKTFSDFEKNILKSSLIFKSKLIKKIDRILSNYSF